MAQRLGDLAGLRSRFGGVALLVAAALTSACDSTRSGDHDREGWLEGIAATDTGLVAVGLSAEKPLILVSEDGASWSSADTPSEHGSLRDVAAGNAIVAAVGPGGVGNSQVVRRADGAWQLQLLGQNYEQVLFGNGVFFVNAGVEGAATSSDGASWTPTSWARAPGLGSLPFAASFFAFDGRRFLAVDTGADEYRSSSDGVSWTEPQPSGFSETSPTTIAAVGDQILVLGWSRTSDSEGHGVLFLGTPDDELSAFTRIDLDWIDIPRAVASDGERVVVACRSSLRTTSLPIGSSEWSKFDADSLGSSLADVAYHGGRFVAVGSRDTEVSVLTSSDGMSWSRAPVP